MCVCLPARHNNCKRIPSNQGKMAEQGQNTVATYVHLHLRAEHKVFMTVMCYRYMDKTFHLLEVRLRDINTLRTAGYLLMPSSSGSPSRLPLRLDALSLCTSCTTALIQSPLIIHNYTERRSRVTPKRAELGCIHVTPLNRVPFLLPRRYPIKPTITQRHSSFKLASSWQPPSPFLPFVAAPLTDR